MTFLLIYLVIGVVLVELMETVERTPIWEQVFWAFAWPLLVGAALLVWGHDLWRRRAKG